MDKYFYKKEIKIPLYEGKFIIILSNDVDNLKKYIPKFERTEIYASTWLLDWRERRGIAIILNFDNSLDKIRNGTITHEAIHFSHFVAEEAGFEPSFSNDEPIAYLAGWATDNIYKFMDKHNKKAN